MSVDPPRPDVDSDDQSPRNARDAAKAKEDTSSGPSVPSTETLRDAPSRVPKRIGHYHIKRVLASGGMGTVYEATQEKPRRTVALKLMKQGIASRSALRRFEYESQILARLRHPGIAQVYEAGTHRDDSGTVPFFAMEYIVGAKPITKYVKEKKLGTRERMILFAQVCDAVNHGHQKGIIHRDLKPSNILVDAQGQVKIIDFGVARSTDSDMAVTTLQTDIGQLIGTLQYMSPEQCEADPHNIDTRSDVYALGVVFYELLCGKLPYNVTRVAIHEATRIIRERHPTKLSTLNKTLRGDVETIALKALEKDRERRYQSATDFAQDIRRYLHNEAIIARPPSVLYQFRVLVRRNKPIFAAIAVVFLVLLGGVIVSTSMYLRSEANRIKAESEATKAQTTLAFLGDMLRAVDPRKTRGNDVSVRSMLDETAHKIAGGELSGQPEVEVYVRTVIGETYVSLGLYEVAEEHLKTALEIQKRVVGEVHLDVGDIQSALGNALTAQAHYEAAEPILRAALETRQELLGENHRETLKSMFLYARLLWRQGKLKKAEGLVRKTLEHQERLLGLEDPDTLHSMNLLGNVVANLGQPSYELYRRTLELRRHLLGEEHPDTLTSMNNFATALSHQGKFAHAERLYREAADIQRRVRGDAHPGTLVTLSNLPKVLRGQGKYMEAEAVDREVLQTVRDVRGDDHPETVWQMVSLAKTLSSQGKHDEAESFALQALPHMRRILGDDHGYTQWSWQTVIDVLVAQGKLDEARPYVAELIRHRKRATEQPDASTNNLNEYAMLLLTCEPEDLRDPQVALPLAQRAVEMSGGKDTAILDTLALAYFMTGDTAKAIETQERAVSLLPPEESPLRTELEASLAKYRAAAEAESTDHELPTPTDTDDENSKTPDDPPGSGG